MEEVVISGGKRTRTADILLAKQALYQLSYTPNIEIWAILDLNQGPHPYQGCALTKLSYRPKNGLSILQLISLYDNELILNEWTYIECNKDKITSHR